MSSAQGRFTSPDPTPLGIALANPQSWNLYAYVLNRPTSFIDANGKWWTPVHVDILNVALGGILAPGDLAHLAARQYVMDADQGDQAGHFMAVPNQDSGDAIENSMKLIAKNMNNASTLTDSEGKMSGLALNALGDAMHTIQDMTSPKHTFDDGTPKVWTGIGTFGSAGFAHWLGENSPPDSWSRFGWAVRLTLAAYVEANPIDAARHGLNAGNFQREAERRIEHYVESYYLIKGTSAMAQEAARLCALGNPAACMN